MITNQSFDELKKEKEDKVLQACDQFDKATLLIAYKQLFNQGLRIEGIDYQIDKLIREEVRRAQE